MLVYSAALGLIVIGLGVAIWQRVPLKVDVAAGPNWLDVEEVP